MRILFADLEREWRGGQSQALLTLQGLRERGHEVELLAAQHSPLAERASKGGTVVHQVPRLASQAWAASALSRLLPRGRFDLVHLNEPHALAAAWLARAHRQLPLLLSRRIGFRLRKNPVSLSLYRALDRFVANSQDVVQSLIDSGISKERISIVNEGVEIPPLPVPEQRSSARKHWGIAEDEFLFGCVGVFVPEKGQRHLIEAMPRVRVAHPEARLILAGDGACLAELQTLARNLQQTEAVLFAGFVNDVAQVYAALDAFVFPSEFEGLGTALQAAMASGLPCISTKRGALGEVVNHEHTALVVEPDAREFSSAMLRLMKDEDLRRRLANSGRREIEERFSADRMVEHTIQVYEDVLRNRRKL